MNWTILQAVADLLAAAAVIISLIYLGKQVRESTTALQSSTILRGTELGLDMRTSLWGDKDNMLVYLGALSGEPSSDPVHVARQRMFWIDLGRRHEAIFLQHLLGHLPDEVWRNWAEELRFSWCSTGGRAALVGLRGFFHPQLASYLSDLQEQTPRGEEGKFRTMWSDALTRERAMAEASLPQQ